MHTALALAPLTLAAVLVLSGLTKLPDPRSTHSMMTLLRLPAAVANPTVARVVPWAELAVAALLLTPWRWTFAVGALAATLLFLTFWVIVARAMTFEPRPTCGCFGRVGDHRINARTVIRNTILVALALVASTIALQGRTGTGLVAEFATGDWLWLLLGLTLAAVAVLVLAAGPDEESPVERTLRQHAHQQDHQHGHGGTAHDEGVDPAEYVRLPIPRGLLVDRDLQVHQLGVLAHQQAQLLVLANCWCGSTVAAIDRVPDWRARLPQLGVQVVHTQPPFDEPRLARLDGVWWDPGARVYTALQAGVSPSAVLLGADGLLAGGPVMGVEEIEQFVADVEAELAQAEPVQGGPTDDVMATPATLRAPDAP